MTHIDGVSLTHRTVKLEGVRLHVVTAGEGPPLYLLHGYPQTWFMWRKVVPLLAPHYRLVMPDLRGYGDSDRPAEGYDKRTMAADIRRLADHLGDRRFGLVGHDRGARVAHRYALDHGETLAGVLLLDIEPTRTVFDHMNAEVALRSWHWLFLPVPDLAEAMIGAAPETWVRFLLRQWAGQPHAIEEAAVAEYLRCFRLPGAIRATCADYRAGAGIDREHDAADAQRKVQVPLRVLWGALGKRDVLWDTLAVWRERATQVSGRAVPEAGHFIPEEQPQAVAEEIRGFFAGLA